ncbi:MAG: secretin N-terminal domain-containing protein [Solirubrobacterales bacterium]
MRSLKVMMVGTVLAVALLLLPGGAAAEEASGTPPQKPSEPVEVVKTNGDTKVKLNFQDAPLQTVLEYLSDTAGLMIISDETLSSSRVTVISRQPITLTEAVSLINSILKEKGLTTVLTGKTLKVVTLTNAKKENLPVLSGRDPNAIVEGDDVVTYVIPVSHVTAAALKTNLEALRPEYASIEANEDGNALIVTDTTANIKRLMKIVVALDQHMSSVAEIRVFPLTQADATSTATLINNLFQQSQTGSSRNRQNNRGGMGGGPFEMMMQMRGDRGGPGGMMGQNQSSQAGGSASITVVAAADEQSNSVVVRGPTDAMDIVAGVIDSLDSKAAKIASVRVYQLRYADASNVADVVNNVFGDQSSSSSRSRGMGGMQFRGPMMMGPGQTGQSDEGGAVSVTAAADSTSNTVVVTGPDSMLEVIDGVIKKLDNQIPNVADVKVFHLKYADATDTSELINEVFGQQSSSSSSSRSRSSRSSQNQGVMFGMRGGPGGMMGPMGMQTSSSGNSSDVSTVASADTQTNSVVVSGPAETLAIIAQVIEQLDVNPEQERRIFVYAMKNGNAENLMTILNNLFTEMASLDAQGTSSSRGQQFQGNTGGQASRGGATTSPTATSSSSTSDEALSDETYFEADPNTNSLLCMTSKKNYDKIKPIIEELDKPVGQVLIKVLFAEVTLTDQLDVGTELAMTNVNNNGTITTTDTFGRPDGIIAPWSGTGETTPGGLQIRAIQGDLDLTLHALQEKTKLNVLSRPYVLTRSNQMATITVAEEVPIPSSSTSASSGGGVGTQTSYEYRDDIGIVLEVTPSVNPDGLVNMVVNPKITEISGKVQISEDLEATQFSTRSASTRVAVMNGQTIVIGGLIKDKVNKTVKQVPLLGDIPLVGNLFKRTETGKEKIELLIFLTPCVAQEPAELTPISDTEEGRSTISQDKTSAEAYKRHMEAMKNATQKPETDPNDKK